MSLADGIAWEKENPSCPHGVGVATLCGLCVSDRSAPELSPAESFPSGSRSAVEPAPCPVQVPFVSLSGRAAAPPEKTFKLDNTKPDMSLIPPYPLFALASVVTGGAVKYERDGWAAGGRYRRLLSASKRHIDLFLAGQDNDPEFGTPHLAHAMFGCMCILQFMAEGRADLDDRRKNPEALAAIEALYKLLDQKLPEIAAAKAAREAGKIQK